MWRADIEINSLKQSFYFIVLCCRAKKKSNDNCQFCIIYFHYYSKEFCYSYQMTSPLACLPCSKSLPVYLVLITSPKITLEALWLISKALPLIFKSIFWMWQIQTEICTTWSRSHVPKDLFFPGPTNRRINDDWLDFNSFYLYGLHILYSLKACTWKRNSVCIMKL